MCDKNLSLLVVLWATGMFYGSRSLLISFYPHQAGSSCLQGLLAGHDDVFIEGKVSLDYSTPSTQHRLEVSYTMDNLNFHQLCQTRFSSQDCHRSSGVGCFCQLSQDNGRVMLVTVKVRAHTNMSAAFAHIEFFLSNDEPGVETVVRLPVIYGKPKSYIKFGRAVAPLIEAQPCEIQTDHKSSHGQVVQFCTDNLSSGVMTLACDHSGFILVFNSSCLGYQPASEDASRDKVCNFTYSDSCTRSLTFQCSVKGPPLNEEAISEAKPTGDSSSNFYVGLVIFVGAALGTVFLMNVAYAILKHSDAKPGSARTRQHYDRTKTAQLPTPDRISYINVEPGSDAANLDSLSVTAQSHLVFS